MAPDMQLLGHRGDRVRLFLDEALFGAGGPGAKQVCFEDLSKKVYFLNLFKDIFLEVHNKKRS